MQTNLTRLSDLAGEIRRQLKPLGRQAEVARKAQSVAAVACYALLAVALHAEGSPERPLDWVTFFLVLTTPWFVGLLVEQRS
ncbi:hypothetical protein IAE22_35250, partial [Bacillus sp. S34]|nr:hypothetical protein [Bacillus sp. S34]